MRPSYLKTPLDVGSMNSPRFFNCTMDNIPREKIIKDLEKTGFGSEMRAIREFLSRKWDCTGNFSYFDKDAQISREGDLHASRLRSKDLGVETAILRFYIVGEVKKSEKPWVVFKESKIEFWSTDAWQNLTYYHNLPCPPVNLVPFLTQDSLVTKLKWAGYGIHESFKKPNKTSRWYTSFVSSCKAAEHVLSASSLEKKSDMEIFKKLHGTVPYLSFVMPVVILEGTLLSAEITDNGEMNIEEIEAAPFEFHFRTTNYNRRQYRIDLVTLSSLSKYISLCEERQDKIFAGICAKCKVKRA